MSIYLKNDRKMSHNQNVCKYTVSFDERNLSYLLDAVCEMYPKEEIIRMKRRFYNESDLKKFVFNFLGATQIIEYYDFSGKVYSEFYCNYEKIKITRKPIIYDMMSRWLLYKKSYSTVSKKHFKDIYLTDLITELKSWYEETGITVAEEYSSVDKTLQARKKDCDSHITKEKKLQIIQKILQNIRFEKIGCIDVDTLTHTINLIKQLDIFNSNATISEITQIVKRSKQNYGFLISIGYNPKYIGKQQIVVSNIHGLLADRDMFTGRISHVSKFYNNDNDPEKDDVYFEEKTITCETQFFKVATPEDVYAYREFYYLLDGTRPFLNMSIEEIKEYLEENN